MEAWQQMWVIAFAIYAGCKWLTYQDGLLKGSQPTPTQSLIYLAAWPGMSIQEFLRPPDPSSGGRRELRPWLIATLKTLLGAFIAWRVVPWIAPEWELLRGWTGMIGIILMLHFGLFHLLSLGLQAAGFNARPNMRAPMRAGSLAEFWGHRWNTAFNTLVREYLFRPLTPRIGPRWTLLAAFFASGLVHELVITVPARAAYGWPTLYFLLQGIGLLAGRMPWLRRHSFFNRMFAWMVLVIPLGALFPPEFVRIVILPLLAAIGIH
jgi:alginate O-acetyltransferase complex protein AlgI